MRMPVAGFLRALIPPPLLMFYSVVEIDNIMLLWVVKHNKRKRASGLYVFARNVVISCKNIDERMANIYNTPILHERSESYDHHPPYR